MAFVQGVYLVLVLLEVPQQNVFHVAAYRHLAPAYHRHDTHQLLVRGTAHVQGLSVCQFHFLKLSFLVVARTALAPAGCRFLYLHRFCLCFLRYIIRLIIILFTGNTLRDKLFHEILVYLRHPAALLCHIILI